MKVVLETPAKLRISEASDEELTGLHQILKYKDSSVDHMIRNLKKNIYHSNRYGSVWVQNRLDQLNKELWKPLIFQDEKGHYTLSGLVSFLRNHFPDLQFENEVKYPAFKLIPWQNKPPYEPKNYQQVSLSKFLENPHSHVELATGLGKSFIAILLAKHTGLPTVISTPSASIARQFYKELVLYFGKKNVGLLGAGKKEVGKHILVAVGKSLSMVQPEEAENFAKYQVLISDESHTLPANQFSHFCMNVLGHCPYRWFLSATQERNDGRDLLLEGLIGPRVYEKSIKEGIEEGHLAKLSTLIFDVESSSDFISQNAKLMSQRHFYENKDILDIISIIVPDALKQNIPTLILVDEHAQEELIRNRIGKVYEYASGGSDTLKICEDFNQKKIMCVVGTSAVSTGTNFKPTRLTINWQSGKAETKFKQGVIGRSTRLDEGKDSCRLVDFRIKNVPMMLKHANHRIKLYREVGPVEFLEYRK